MLGRTFLSEDLPLEMELLAETGVEYGYPVVD